LLGGSRRRGKKKKAKGKQQSGKAKGMRQGKAGGSFVNECSNFRAHG
jgi:hypothetical protein